MVSRVFLTNGHFRNSAAKINKGPFNNYEDKMRGGGGQKMSVFVRAQGIKTVHAEYSAKKNFKFHAGVKKCRIGNFSDWAVMDVPC